MNSKQTISDEQFEETFRIAAKIVRDHGDIYLPLFQRMNDERMKRKSQRDLKSIALQAADAEL